MNIPLLVQAQGLALAPAAFQLNSYSRYQKEGFAFSGNPAALGQIKKWSAALHGERPYMLNELSVYNGMLALPLADGGIVVSGALRGQHFRELMAGFGYGKSIGNLDAGLQFSFHQFSAAHYGRASFVQVQGGLIYHVNEHFRTGIHLVNPVSGSLNKLEKLPFQYAAALGYDASEQFFLGVALKKTRDRPVSFDLGLQYQFDKSLRARAGMQTDGGRFYCGGGFLWGNIELDVTLAMHQQLGLTPSLALSFHPANK